MNIKELLSAKVSKALMIAGVPAIREVQVRRSKKTKFGNYQVNCIMAIAKHLGIPSQVLAQKVANQLELDGIAQKIEVVDPGFINIYLTPQWLAMQIDNALCSPRLGTAQAVPQTIVVDYSAPNIAKEMHVGHLRSTIIGDAMVRILSFLGHNVIRANHIGDWGTQFGMLIAFLEQVQSEGKEETYLPCIEKFYREAKKNYEKDQIFAKKARSCVVKLQSGDSYYRQIWRKLVDITIEQNQKIYDRLNLTLTSEDIMGESLYKDMLPDIVTDLRAKGLAVKSKGATVVFLENFKNKEGKPMGVIIQKQDGAYLYTTIDIACVKYRYEKFKADRVIYCIDSRQHQHLMQAWTIARKAGYVPESVSLEHHIFGMMLGKDGKPFKTRAGGTVKLMKLLDEAWERAYQLVAKKNPDMDTIELEKLANIIGIGAVKYADLSKNRTINYVFDWNNILSFEGNTAPYIQYAYSRICSIFKRSSQKEQQLVGNVKVEEKQEIKLAVSLLQFEEIITTVAHDGTPHILCGYLYNLAVLFSSFYEECPILNADSKLVRQSRLKLALLTARTLKQGLNLLGIDTVEHM